MKDQDIKDRWLDMLQGRTIVEALDISGDYCDSGLKLILDDGTVLRVSYSGDYGMTQVNGVGV